MTFDLSVVRDDVPVDSEAGACDDFVNLKGLPARSSEVIIEVGFACVPHMSECACIVIVCVILCNKKIYSIINLIILNEISILFRTEYCFDVGFYFDVITSFHNLLQD